MNYSPEQNYFDLWSENYSPLDGSSGHINPLTDLLSTIESFPGSGDVSEFGLYTNLSGPILTSDDGLLVPGLENISDATEESLKDPLTGGEPPRTASQLNNIPEFLVGNLNGFQSFGEFVGNGDPEDIYQFNLSQGTNFALSLEGLSADADVELYQDANVNGVIDFGEFVSNSTSGGNTPELINQILTPGTYFVRVYQYSGDTAYTLNLSSQPALTPIDPAGNILLQALDLGVLSAPITLGEFVGTVDPDDYYRFNVATEGNFALSLNGLTADADVELIQDRNSNGVDEFDEVLLSSSFSGVSAEEIMTNLGAGTYYVRVYQYRGDTNYALNLSLSPSQGGGGSSNIQVPEFFLGNLNGFQSFGEFVGNADAEDIYQFSLNQTSNFALSLEGLSADADVELYQDLNANGILDIPEFINGSSAPSNSPEAINQLLEAGTYFVRVHQYSGETAYTLNLFSEAVATPTDPAGNSLLQALDLGTLSGSLNLGEFVGTVDPNDYYRFSLGGDTNFALYLDGLAADADVQLIQDRNSNGIDEVDEVLTYSNLGGISSEPITTNLGAGTYYVRVYQYSGDTNYLLSLNATSINSSQRDGAGNNLPTAYNMGILNNTQFFSDFVGDSDIIDVYSFDLDTPSNFNLSLDGLVADADVYLVHDFNKDGEITFETETLAQSILSNTSPEAINLEFLEAGTYEIIIHQYLGNTNYGLTVTATPTGIRPDVGNTQLGFNPNFGFGLVDASAAVARAIGAPAPFPDVPNAIEYNYGVDLLNAPEVWNQGFSGAGVVVAVLDTGIDFKHPDLQPNLWVNIDEIPGDGIDNDFNGFIDDTQGFDFVNFDPNPSAEAEEEHGTHVAGTIAALRDGIDGTLYGQRFDLTGVAYNAQIMPLRVLGPRGASDDSIAAAIRYAVTNGARVINLSLGAPEPDTQPLVDALQFARQQGVVVVAASGNEKELGAIQPGYPALESVNNLSLAVGAVDRNRTVADFSNPASALFGPYDFVVAPGVGVISSVPNNRYDSWDGTSMATPHVAGVVALMLQANPNLTPDQVEQILRETANPNGITVA